MKTTEEIKKGLECCILETDDTSLVDHCRACPYQPTGLCFQTLLKDALTLINQLEAERDSALSLIGKLAVILRNPRDAATNGCADKAHEAIKKWLLHDLRQLSKPKEG